MKVGPLKKVSSEVLADVNRLVSQLRRDAGQSAGTKAQLRSIVENQNVVMVVAKDEKRIVGMATLYIQHKIGKRTAHIEDVVVDEAYRGQGLGEKIMKTLIGAAKSKNVEVIHLTSRPERKAGNALYKKLGFTVKKTNPYRLYL